MPTKCSCPKPRFRSLLNRAIVRRSAVIALGIGSILLSITQAGAIFGDDKLQWFPLVLAYLTPFVVVTISQLLGVQQATLEICGDTGWGLVDEPLLGTVVGHGIPLRALCLGVAVGSVNLSLVLLVALLANDGPNSISLVLPAQTFCLPLLFGTISQALAFRRTTRRQQDAC